MSKTTLITGGLGGIGQALVTTFHARGDQIIIFDCAEPTDVRAQAVVASGMRYVQVDLASVASIKQGFASLSLSSLDILINNAGITSDMLSLRLSEDAWDRVMAVNLKGAFFCSQQALAIMIKQPKSYIINMSSVVGRLGNPGQANYAASKAGLISLTKTLAVEYARRNVLVNAIAPGFIDTAMTRSLPDSVKQKIMDYIPLKRFGSPQDVAAIAAFLTSGAADYVTGQIIEVTGGM